MASDMVGKIGRGYIQPDCVDNIMKARFDSKCNGKALKDLRTFPTDNSGCGMNGWKGNSERRKTYGRLFQKSR